MTENVMCYIYEIFHIALTKINVHPIFVYAREVTALAQVLHLLYTPMRIRIRKSSLKAERKIVKSLYFVILVMVRSDVRSQNYNNKKQPDVEMNIKIVLIAIQTHICVSYNSYTLLLRIMNYNISTLTKLIF